MAATSPAAATAESAGTSPRRAASIVPPPSLLGIAALGMIGTMYAALLYAPTERLQGDVQRIFYIHVPAAMTMYLAITVVFVASLLYLQSRNARWDEVAASAGEVGLVFGTIVLTTGPVWARPIWGAWWTWDARLTSFFILWLLFVAYVMMRTYGGAPEQVARFCAVLGILGFIGMPLTHYSVIWFRTLHPGPIVMTEGEVGGGLGDSRMLMALAIGTAANVALFATLFTLRLRLERQARRVQEMRRRIDIEETSR